MRKSKYLRGLRNDKLIEEYNKGVEIKLLEAIFGISKQRIYQILKEKKILLRKNRQKNI